MNTSMLNEISNLTRSDDIFYIAYGKLNQSILQSVVATTKDGVYNGKIKKEFDNAKIDTLITVAIEMIQNVSKYREEIENYNNDLILITTNENITVSTSNLTNAQNKENISKNIDFLNSLNEEELRKHYREAMRKVRNKDENKNSSGLGLIEIARLTKANIEYEFSEYKRNANLFHFNITVVI